MTAPEANAAMTLNKRSVGAARVALSGSGRGIFAYDQPEQLRRGIEDNLRTP
jgi:hypothetical protein